MFRLQDNVRHIAPWKLNNDFFKQLRVGIENWELSHIFNLDFWQKGPVDSEDRGEKTEDKYSLWFVSAAEKTKNTFTVVKETTMSE